MECDPAFTRALIALDRQTRCETTYRGHVLTQMLDRHRCGVAAARELLRPTKAGVLHQGLVDLWLAGRVDLSVEALVVQKRWRGHFTEAELAEAFHRLSACGYRVSKAA